jgi:hypothetical protein
MPRFCAAMAIASRHGRAANQDFQPLKSVVLACGWLNTMCRMVGTQCEKLTFSSLIRRQITSGW